MYINVSIKIVSSLEDLVGLKFSVLQVCNGFLDKAYKSAPQYYQLIFSVNIIKTMKTQHSK